ncbi:acyltransferase family protein [Mucilaginibacter sp. KACC 22063]|uniref:acyltransferase family protein n=1 Tax=Mucilaginibacter sp. KACC 22063 TaxID=3025666 RepID=UPI0023672662|nr:acyltransferase [Mucilaginibacter sp. KACC 22063]WDF55048.1 acyltransferase [Mucilaginibacter sp. KACC 22063]
MTNLLQTKKHFEVLDGMRGIAALAVVTFHFMEMFITDYSKNFIGHGFLAVDFFFCLSGFVIGYAYDDRISKIGLGQFFKSRLIRLHPLVFLGSVLGLITFLFDPFGGNLSAYSPGRILLLFITSVLLIPFPVMNDRANNLFGLNAPAWSLFWEYIANIIYALVLCRLNRKWLIPLVIIAAGSICYVAYRSGSVMGGWGGPSFWDGSARISYSFLAGLIIYRFNLIIKNPLGFIGMGILLLLTFLMPFGKWNWLTEPFVVLIYYPLIVALGAGTVSGGLKKLCNFSGEISYPLYMTHYCVLWMFGNYYASQKPDSTTLALVIVSSIILLVVFAWLVMTFYDKPVRRFLTLKFNRPQAV